MKGWFAVTMTLTLVGLLLSGLPKWSHAITVSPVALFVQQPQNDSGSSGQPRGKGIYAPAGTRTLAFSPDSKFLAAGGNSQVLVWNLSTGQLKQDWKTLKPISSVAFSPHGITLATHMEGDPFVRLLDTETGKVTGETGNHDYPISSVAYSEDGKTLACGTKGFGVYLWTLEKGKATLVAKPKAPLREVFDVRFTPDGKLAAALDKNGKLHYWDVATGALKKEQAGFFPLTPDSPDRSYHDLYSFAPNGKYLVSWYFKSRISVLALDGANEKKAQAIKLNKEILGVVVSADSKSFFVRLDKSITQWELPENKMIREFAVTGEPIEAFALSAKDNLLAACTRDGKIHVWRTDT